MGVGGRKSQKNGLVTGASFFSSPRLTLCARFALRSKCRVRLAWIIKCLLCRLLLTKIIMKTSRNILRVKPTKPYLRVVIKNNRKSCRFKLIIQAIGLADQLVPETHKGLKRVTRVQCS